ncbi:hypothetical protein HK097_007798 [Rhizophlyctis rosea]|uniref:Uncharacterized protein n=1 Tax=Rhizophlyctis rosea TaxID=64517 RepID=A0AAD5SII9_9FUNG|nr:hypothetical protein HK097_007798 [Rhizophlyctis rosea]
MHTFEALPDDVLQPILLYTILVHPDTIVPLLQTSRQIRQSVMILPQYQLYPPTRLSPERLSELAEKPFNQYTQTLFTITELRHENDPEQSGACCISGLFVCGLFPNFEIEALAGDFFALIEDTKITSETVDPDSVIIALKSQIACRDTWCTGELRQAFCPTWKAPPPVKYNEFERFSLKPLPKHDEEWLWLGTAVECYGFCLRRLLLDRKGIESVYSSRFFRYFIAWYENGMDRRRRNKHFGKRPTPRRVPYIRIR